MDKTELIFNEINLSTRLSPRLEFPNSSINSFLLGGIDTILEYIHSKGLFFWEIYVHISPHPT